MTQLCMQTRALCRNVKRRFIFGKHRFENVVECWCRRRVFRIAIVELVESRRDAWEGDQPSGGDGASRPKFYGRHASQNEAQVLLLLHRSQHARVSSQIISVLLSSYLEEVMMFRLGGSIKAASDPRPSPASLDTQT